MHLIVTDDVDTTTRHVWEFLVTADQRNILVRVESYALEEKLSTRHKWRPQRRWHRLSSMSREWGMATMLKDHPAVPDDVRLSLRAQLERNTHLAF